MAGYSMALHSVYNHYLTTYASKSVSRYDTHKKSELRNIYNSIVKLNKESPLCIVDTSDETRQFAVGIKENARLLHNTIASLGGLNEEDLLNKKMAYSSNENLASAKYIGAENNPSVILSFDIAVNSLASPQVNMGAFLPSRAPAVLAPESYSFDVNINDLNYEFQFQIGVGETNQDIQNRLSRLINNANIGLNADVLEDDLGNSALVIRSSAAGKPTDRDSIFQISDDRTSRRSGTVEYFGIDTMTQAPSNASILLNGKERSAASNTFSVEKTYEITLNGISADSEDTASIGLKTDTDSLSDNIEYLIDGYNHFLEATSEYRELHPKSHSLLTEMNRVSSIYKNDLESIGLNIGTDGTLSMDKSVLQESIFDGNAEPVLEPIRHFTHAVLQKTNQISLDPMKYVEKTIVAYKNPGHNFASPYITSAYSGMLFNSYC
ncbi:MAG: flagellar capping protein [Lachnospiraceae bacterium]|nr:flagellar capping protein [Lachnospiraceae bacterium]